MKIGKTLAAGLSRTRHPAPRGWRERIQPALRGTPRDSSAFQATFFPARLELDGEPLDRGAYLRSNITHS
jgi:hypothetical protein